MSTTPQSKIQDQNPKKIHQGRVNTQQAHTTHHPPPRGEGGAHTLTQAEHTPRQQPHHYYI